MTNHGILDDGFTPAQEISTTPLPSGVVQTTNSEAPEFGAEPEEKIYASSIYGYNRRQNGQLYPTDTYITQIGNVAKSAMFRALEREREQKNLATDVVSIATPLYEALHSIQSFDNYLGSNFQWRLERWVENEVSYNMASAAKYLIDGKERASTLLSRGQDPAIDKSVQFCDSSSKRCRNTAVALVKVAIQLGLQTGYDFDVQAKKVAEQGAARLNRNAPPQKSAEELAKVSANATVLLFADEMGEAA